MCKHPQPENLQLNALTLHCIWKILEACIAKPAEGPGKLGPLVHQVQAEEEPISPLGIIFYSCLYKTQEDIQSIMFIKVVFILVYIKPKRILRILFFIEVLRGV